MIGDASITWLLLTKASAVLGAALLAARLLRRSPAARRHRLWSVTFGALAALPALGLALPALRVPLPTWTARARVGARAPVAVSDAARPAAVPTASIGATTGTSAPAAPAGTATPASRGDQLAPARDIRGELPSLRSLGITLWLAGVLAALGALIVALVRSRLLAATAQVLDDPEWAAACARIARQFGLEAPVRVLASSRIETPMAGGIGRPTVFVPRSARTWSAELREIVLAHELAHLASRDPLRNLVSRVALLPYWFHPLAWLAARRAVAACEQACDEAVLALGVRPSAYARALMQFADAVPFRGANMALPMVRRSQLEARIMAILDPSRPAPARRTTFLPAAAIAALTLMVAAARPAGPTDTDAATPAPASSARRTGSPASVAAATTVGRMDVTAAARPAAPCWSDELSDQSFSGTMSTSERGGMTVLSEEIGQRGNTRVIQTRFGDLRVCARAEGLVGDSADVPSAWAGRASHLLLETQQNDDARSMDISGGRVTWTVNGEARPVDAAANEWRERLLALLDPTWELSRLRGRVSSLRGEISSIEGQQSSLLGQISSLRGQVSSMEGEISSVRGQESSLRGEISSVRGHVSSLEGEISSERGAISSLQASSWDQSADERDRVAARVREHEAAIQRIQDEIRRYDENARVREVEARIRALGADGAVAAIEKRIADFDVERRVAAVNQQIAQLDVEKRVSDIGHRIDSLDADRRGRELEARMDEALARLRDSLRGR